MYKDDLKLLLGKRTRLLWGDCCNSVPGPYQVRPSDYVTVAADLSLDRFDVPKIKKDRRGGKRKGAGRKRALEFEKRREIASDYFARMWKDRDRNSLRREAVIDKLIAKYGVTHRMVERCVTEFLRCVRENSA